ncbi:hypothetical protein REC12_23645 [Desulfosporosinus sp. PR]|uniref:hypothetical protein n=1 Tax=Candidatus Desulfosporosinus nitrosoreducens TaxID=3401928 RepID=UPI0027EF2D9A|nr:hypothetical protein [Desulfosporosinus sp. PR]MDQ7096594.1 hypothetical protein [Desulfosporosinus sp. PR]
MKKVLLFYILVLVLVFSSTACSKTITSKSDSIPKQYENADKSSQIFAPQDVSIKIGGMPVQKTIKSGQAISVPYGNGIIPIFIEVKGTSLSKQKLMKVLVEPSSWHFESKNWPTEYTYFFDIRLDESAPLAGKVTLSEIRGENNQIIVDQPVTFTITLVK